MGVFSIFWNAIWKFSDDGGMAIASHLALSLLLSLFPFLILTASLIGVWGSEELTEQVVHLIFDNWPAETAQSIVVEVNKIIGGTAGNIFSLSSLVALILASNGIEAAREGLNRAYKVRETRSWLWRRLQGGIFVIVGAMLLIFAALLLVATPFAWEFAVVRMPLLEPYSTGFVFVRYGVALLLLSIVLFAFHYYLPDTRQDFRKTMWGIAFTLGAIIIGSNLFAIYLREMANYTALYAGLAGTMVTIIYLYVISLFILFGGELNTAIMEAEESAAA